jgi:apolipoprotein N-acyltransferase
MTENRHPSDRDEFRLSTPAAGLLAGVGIVAFHVACEWPAVAGVVVIYLLCLYRLAWVSSARRAFYLGLGIGICIAAPQLWFFVGIFGPAAVGLWLILGLWIALYLLLAHVAVARWPRRGPWLLPWLWFALEYFRCELYYLRFAWLIPGFALSDRTWVPLASVGVYGFSLVVMLLAAMGRSILQRQFTADSSLFIVTALIATVAQAVSFAGMGRTPTEPPSASPFVVGIQLESPSEADVIESLNLAVARQPQCDLIVLSEYTFDGPVPASVLVWCHAHGKYVIAGGKDPVRAANVNTVNDYYDTAFVIGPSGEIVFRQGKAVPIQFMNDGLPAPSQQVWKSPWGNIGIAIC